MAAFPGPEPETTIVIRNHEINPGQPTGHVIPPTDLRYDPLATGGTSTLVIDGSRTLQQEFISLAGTYRNCAGGPTPWGSWLSCEEIIVDPTPVVQAAGLALVRHGYVFEVSAGALEVVPTAIEPLVALGRFHHEAAAIDPATGLIYQTEDRNDGCFYRFIPQEPGNLRAGGQLQALAIVGIDRAVTANQFKTSQGLGVRWIDLEDPDPVGDTLRYQAQNGGAAIFRRGEGCWYSDGWIYFTCTNGGKVGAGQIWRYNPGTEMLELFVESKDRRTLDAPDNITVTPFGDLLVCEDGQGKQFLVGITPQGEPYPFARNALNTSEFAGACFAPDGQTLFVNIQNPGLTLAIWGPWV
jgi:secreted PhoX family phosphatase